MTAARAEVVSMIADILRDGGAGDLGHRPLLVWITDEASGPPPFSLTVTARSQSWSFDNDREIFCQN
jgi:hypothetical protein